MGSFDYKKWVVQNKHGKQPGHSTYGSGNINEQITTLDTEINNLKDIMLSRLQSWGIVNKHNKFEYLAITYKSIVDQYWREKDLPNEERAIYMIGCTDDELKAAQQKQLDEYRDGEKFYKRRT